MAHIDPNLEYHVRFSPGALRRVIKGKNEFYIHHSYSIGEIPDHAKERDTLTVPFFFSKTQTSLI